MNNVQVVRALSEAELDSVFGGSEEMSDVEKVRANAATATNTCGPGNVKSVSTTGFECKD